MIRSKSKKAEKGQTKAKEAQSELLALDEPQASDKEA